MNITITTSVHPHHKHHIAWLEIWHIILLTHIASSLVPTPPPPQLSVACSAVLQVTESWAGPENEATLHQCLFIY